jgi:hypothetical protein
MASGPRSRGLALLLVALLAACDQRGDTLDHFEAFPQFDAVKDLEIAGLDDDGRAFLAPDQMQIAGELVVFLHRQERRVRVADRETGRSLRTLVEPGQMQVPTRLGVIDDAVWVRDARPDPMFRLFALAGGSQVDKVPAGDWTYEGHTVRGVHLTSKREVIAATATPSAAIVRGVTKERTLLRIVGGVLEPLVSVAREQSVLGFVRDDGGGIYSAQPFSDDPLYALSPDGYRLAILERRVTNSADPASTLELRHVDDDSIVRRPLRYSPRPIERHWVDDIVRDWQRELGLPYSHSEPLIRNRLHQPNHLPFASDLRLDVDGRAWIRVWDPAEMILEYNLRSSPPTEATWLVIDLDGSPAGRVVLSTDLRWLQAAGDAVWGAKTADDGTGIIVRYRMTSATDESS